MNIGIENKIATSVFRHVNPKNRIIGVDIIRFFEKISDGGSHF